MANLPENSTFDTGVYQLETTDPVLGGADGVSNQQAKQLANRTRWLKDQVDSLNLLKGTGIPAFSTENSYSAGQEVIYQKNIWRANTSIAAGAFNSSKWTKQLGSAAERDAQATLTDATAGALMSVGAFGIGSTNAAAGYNNWASVPLVSGVYGVVSGATNRPAGLPDGFYILEVGAYDSSFALAYMISSGRVFTIARSNSGTWSAAVESASLNSPSFSGAPTAPTPPQFDNDTSIATTEFVQRALGNLGGVDSYNASFTLVASQAGRGVLYYGGTDASAVLPLSSACPTGSAFLVHNVSGFTLTVQRQGGDVLLGVGGATSVALGPGDSLLVANQNASGQWTVVGGSAQYRYSYSATLKANTSGSYPGMSVGYATSAGNADTVDGWHAADIRTWSNLIGKPAGADLPFIFAASPGSPQYVWGSTDAGTSHIYAAENLSVSYAATAGYAPVTTSQILTAIAGAAAGAVGTYVFGTIANTGVRIGSIYAGSEILPSGVYATSVLPPDSVASGINSALVTGSSYLTGSWMAMGTIAHQPANFSRGTLFLRIV